MLTPFPDPLEAALHNPDPDRERGALSIAITILRHVVVRALVTAHPTFACSCGKPVMLRVSVAS